MPTRKTKIDDGSPWRWYVDPVPDRDYLALATFIELGSVRDLPRFEWYTLRVHRQLARTPGLVGYSCRGQFPLRYWTLSAWESGRALYCFLKAGSHETVMAALPETTQQFRHVHWQVAGSALRWLGRMACTGWTAGTTPARRRLERGVAGREPEVRAAVTARCVPGSTAPGRAT